MIRIAWIVEFGAGFIADEQFPMVSTDSQNQVSWIEVVLVFKRVFKTGLEYMDVYILV
jgi:hypothetical protein